MGMMGLLGLLIAFAGTLVSIVCFIVTYVYSRKDDERAFDRADTAAWGARVGVILTTAGLTFCCAILLWAFFAGDMSLDYVLRNHSDSQGADSWLYKLAGLWAGREGSLLFWAWLISVFNLVVVLRTNKTGCLMDNMALMIAQIVLAAFVGVLLFSESNMPFALSDVSYFNADGSLTKSASMLGMNTLLEHWAMAIHPPTLFIGYAGLTIPFAYAIAALITNDDSTYWVVRCTPYAMFSWVFLGIGIGLGAVWAYVVLGWGGYWGWDPVENASLLPWLVGVALIHSFTVYRRRGTMKRWSVMCACLAFATVILGTFITRSGIVQSVHAFEGDPVSLALFLGLIVVSLAVGGAGLIARRKTFAAGTNESDSQAESMASRETAYYINNLLMILFAVLLAYMTVSSALPSFLPFGEQAISTGTYNAIARPLGIAYCLLIAVCPLLGWHHTDAQAFWKRARIPGVCAIVLFALLMAYFLMYLLPSYNAIINSGGNGAEGLLEQGAPAYYNGLAIVGFAVASVLVFNAAFMLVKAFKGATASTNLRARLSAIGGSMCHLAMGVILVGLIGSSMYVTERQTYIPYDSENDTADVMTIQDYELLYTGNSIDEVGNDVLYTVNFDIYKDGAFVGMASPSVSLDATTQQQKLNAAVICFPLEDLFIVYRGVNDDGAFSMDVRVNPLISVVWIGFALLIAGSVIALFAKRRRTTIEKQDDSDCGSGTPAEPTFRRCQGSGDLTPFRERVSNHPTPDTNHPTPDTNSPEGRK